MSFWSKQKIISAENPLLRCSFCCRNKILLKQFVLFQRQIAKKLAAA
jgi:hypothetical protein